MSTPTNLDRLKAIMKAHDLKRRDVATLLGKPLTSGKSKKTGKPRSNSTVDAWLQGSNPCPNWAIELLEFKLAARESDT